MKKKLIIMLSICTIMILFNTKVNALTGTTTISETPSATEKGSYITLRHTIDVATDNITIEYTYDSKYLQLVGFIPTNSATCSFTNNSISCSNVTNNAYFVYPVFKIVATFNANKDISATFNSTIAANTTKTTINKVDKVIDVTGVSLDSNHESLIVNQTYQIIATISPENATNKTITYSSSDENVATVNNEGLVTAIGPGTATITVSSGTINTVFTLTVTEEEIPLEKITIVESLDMKVGDSKSLEVTFTPENTTINTSELVYSSSDSKVAIVDANGKVVAISSGTATITVSLGDLTTSTKVTIEEEEKKENKSNSSFGACLVTAIITFVVTLLLIFIKNLIKRKKELNSVSDDGDDDFKLNSYN